MNPAIARGSAGGALALLVGAGIFLSGKPTRDVHARVVTLREAGITAEEALADLRARQLGTIYDEETFASAVADDIRRFETRPIDLQTLRQPNAHFVELEDATVLAPGKSWRSDHLSVAASVQKVQYRKQGASISASHSIATLENVSDKPIAYLVRLRSAEQGNCEVRGARMHNVMALLPGEKAEIVVCAGGGSIRVERVEILELTELGYYYVSQLPPASVGHDPTESAAHHPLKRVPLCTQLDAQALGAGVRAGTMRWVDVMDYFSRHACERFEFVPEYRHATEALPRLPVVPREVAAVLPDASAVASLSAE